MSVLRSRPAFQQFKVIGFLLLAAAAARGGRAQVGPVLIPYTMNVVAGNPQVATGGYSGDGGKAVGTTLNAPFAVAVDTVGNIYFADSSNAVIREINVQTGNVKIVAGIPPTGCTNAVCTTTHPGFADGPATTTGIGTAVHGMALDGYGNLYFADSNQADIRVLYRGGAQVANFIATVDPLVPSAAKVVPGNIYLVAGGGPALGPTSGTTGSVDKVLATQATFSKGNLQQIGLDGAGNIYAQDIGNAVIRVINTQSTPQNFFGVTGLQPGYISAIVNCVNATLTAPCPAPSAGVGIGGPAAGASISGLAGLGVDQYGNVYETTTSGTSISYGGVAYAGGAGNTPLATLLGLEGQPNPVAGDWYSVLGSSPNTKAAPGIPSPEPAAVLANAYNNFVLRTTGITVDAKGNIYFLDYHYPSLYRTDVNSQIATRLNGLTASTGTTAKPAPCGASATTTLLTTDKYGDGCPTLLATISGYRGMATDGAGNLYIADTAYNLIREISVNNQFPATPVGTPQTQTLQVHFDKSNLPPPTTSTTSSPLNLQTGNTDFTIAAPPVCANNTAGLDASIDCTVTVTFNPTRPGLRTGSLQAIGNSGGTSFPLTGTGVGSALALDGGGQTTVGAVHLGLSSSVAVDAVGDVFLTDQSNNQVVEMPAAGGAQNTIGSGLKAPQGVAVDAAGNVYIADTGNNRVVEVTTPGLKSTPTQTVLLQGLAAPQGIAVDAYGNVYVADTGNGRIVEIAADSASGMSVLRQFGTQPGSDGLTKPVAVAVDSASNVYVADAGAGAVFKLPPGGGDLLSIAGPAATKPLVQVGSVATPGGVAVDAAGNVYISDSTTNTVTEVPSGSGPAAAQFTLSFTGLNGPAGLALDAQGNVYVADSANDRVLEMNRTALAVNFGNLPLFQPALAAPLTLSNIGNQLIALNSPVTQLTESTTYFKVSADTCSGTKLFQGLTCGINVQFLPTALGNYTAQLGVQGLSAALAGAGISPLGQVAVAFNQAPAAGVTTASVTATVTQPHGAYTPSGTVTFNSTINEGDSSRGGSTASVTVALAASGGGAATATLPLAGLLPARRYSIVATYNGDGGDTANAAAPFTFVVPGGTPLTVVSTPASFVYGSPVPTLTGTVTGILPADAAGITYAFITPATAKTPVGSYPISLLLSGGNYLNYVVPPAITASGAPAVVTETPAPLVVQANSFTSVYASPDLTYTPGSVTGVNGDTFIVHFTPPNSSALDVGTYPLVPSVTGKTGNYIVTLKNGTLTVTQATPGVTVVANASAVLPTNLPSEQIAIRVASPTLVYGGVPSGTVTLTDIFTPLNSSTPNAPVTIGPLALVAGAAIYTPTSNAFGTHSYSVAYSGDLDFQAASYTTPVTVLVDNPDFFPTTPATPLGVLPGIIPGGNQNIPGQSSATPEQATITLTPVLGYTGTITLRCASPSSYVSCTIAPASIILASATPQTAVISVSTPATLPIDYKSALRLPRKLDYALAFLPLSVFLLIPLSRSRRRGLARYVWVLLLGIGFSVGLSGCGSTLVKFFTPVPQGPQPLTVTATDGTISKTINMTVNIQ